MAGNTYTGYEDYTKASKSYDDFRVSFGMDIILGSLARYAKDKPLSSLNILEAGCGTGNFTEELCSYVGHVTAVDNNDGMLAGVRDKMSQVHNVTLQNVDLRKPLPFEADTFDGLLMVYVIHHLDEVQPDGSNKGEYLRAVVKESARVLKKGAPLIICTFNHEQFKHSIWYFHFASENGFSDILQSHLDRYISLDDVTTICKDAGFHPGPRMVSISEKMMKTEAYCDVNNLHRSELSSWRDLEKHEQFPKFLEAYEQAVENKEVDKWVQESEEIRSRQGMSTFLTFYRT